MRGKKPLTASEELALAEARASQWLAKAENLRARGRNDMGPRRKAAWWADMADRRREIAQGDKP